MQRWLLLGDMPSMSHSWTHAWRHRRLSANYAIVSSVLSLMIWYSMKPAFLIGLSQMAYLEQSLPIWCLLGPNYKHHLISKGRLFLLILPNTHEIMFFATSKWFDIVTCLWEAFGATCGPYLWRKKWVLARGDDGSRALLWNDKSIEIWWKLSVYWDLFESFGQFAHIMNLSTAMEGYGAFNYDLGQCLSPSEEWRRPYSS